jgi:hypothetical protein
MSEDAIKDQESRNENRKASAEQGEQVPKFTHMPIGVGVVSHASMIVGGSPSRPGNKEMEIGLLVRQRCRSN